MSNPDQFLDPFADDELERDGCFPVEQRIPYKLPPGKKVAKQFYRGSCAAASCWMILDDNGIEIPEAYIRGIKVRDELFVDIIDGGHIGDVPEVLRILGLTVPYQFEPNLTLEHLQAATACEKAAIVSMSISPKGAHAIVVDGIEEGMVLIRDPLGESYQVTVEHFLPRWNGKSVIFV